MAATATLEAPVVATGLRTWKIDPSHTSAAFTVKHLMITNVRGEFTNVTGGLKFDPANLAESAVQIHIDVNSVSTRDEKRDAHLKSPDFFDVATHPTITFASTKFEQTGSDELKVTGDLTIHGVTKSVVLNVDGPSAELRDPWGGVRIAFNGRTKINRKDFGLTWNVGLEAGGVLVGDDIKIEFDAELMLEA